MSHLIHDIRESSRHLVREWDMLKAQYGSTGFSNSQCHVLFETGRHGVLTIAELAEILYLDKSTTSRKVKQLIQQGYLQTAAPRHDKRHKPVCLSEKGKVALAQINCEANERVNHALDLLGEEEQQTLLSGLQLYAKVLRRSRLQQGYQIRRIEARDNEAVAALIFQVMNEFGAIGPGFSIEDEEISQMYAAYDQPRATFYVLEYENRIVGCGGIGPLAQAGPEVCELRKMYFLPEARGIGMGKKMLHMCLDSAKEMGYSLCYLETIGSMARARKLYEEFGFVMRDSPLGHTGHFSCEAWMEKDLKL